MLENNQQPKLFDSKTLFAIVLIGLFYLGWQKYLSSKYPAMNPKKTEVSTGVSTTNPANPAVAATSGAVGATGPVTAPVIQEASPELASAVTAEKLTYEDNKIVFKISSAGMAILDYQSKNYFDRKNNPIALTTENKPVLAFVWGPEKKLVNFKLTQENNVFKGVAQVDGYTIERTLTYSSDTYSFAQEILVSNPQGKAAEYSFVSEGLIIQPESSSFLFPSFEFQDLLVFIGDRKENVNVSNASESLKNNFKAVGLYSIGTQYFTTGILDESEILPDLQFSSDISAKSLVHTLTYGVPQTVKALYKQAVFIGPKSSERLKAAHPGFIELMDFGMLSWISKPMLAVMKWFYGIVGNWGVAIILLTLLVRALVLPFNLMSYKSMKGMQTIQPILAGLRERYKDDPVTLNREMMSVMKQNNANPLAGCLPMLLQIPIFFALYKVIGSSVELYQAPFAVWIQDLSIHDKFYVLPVLMGVTMYVQQKMTPTTMDPTQAKILAFMPILFSVFMLNLPAGLTLYMFISAVFGIIQQKTFMKLMK